MSLMTPFCHGASRACRFGLSPSTFCGMSHVRTAVGLPRAEYGARWPAPVLPWHTLKPVCSAVSDPIRAYVQLAGLWQLSRGAGVGLRTWVSRSAPLPLQRAATPASQEKHASEAPEPQVLTAMETSRSVGAIERSTYTAAASANQNRSSVGQRCLHTALRAPPMSSLD